MMIDIDRSGEWMPAEELKEAALKVLSEDKDATFNLNNVNHLDASALQVLLALGVEGTKQERHLHLVNVSPELRQWFDFAGAADHFLMTEMKSDE